MDFSKVPLRAWFATLALGSLGLVAVGMELQTLLHLAPCPFCIFQRLLYMVIGPRPLLIRYLNRYTPEQARRHEVRPGVIVWAQVNGRNALTWEQRFELDMWYVNNLSLWLDLKIIALTVWKILKREGISQPGQAIAEEFMGAFNV